ncbi:HpcH/HpaI aldolase/citrate lyase family protein [uncultured Thiothrix sp.]|uniref:HpcH/HpaI aldolase/citrate lyase family protein n=1 Tax=uncultured Thiothrix sp. TaxID=223185 RepID=UPI00260B55EF|nr:HpcH/HpaI aldolase/citrate lyase family protein [uncultured Thiothrix sp.]HMT92043.1 HpcH/HpaI aldolase/citrate lyase family protein [Thiolinea sp.]
MNNKLSPYQLGATLYMPATRSDLLEVILEQKIPDLRSLVICLEDAIAEHEVEAALVNLYACLEVLYHTERRVKPLVFVRPRHPQMALNLLQEKCICVLDGLVLPKFDHDSFPDWQRVIEAAPTSFCFMPTLETAQILDAHAVRELRLRLQQAGLKSRILVLRIGGNDLLACLQLRTDPQHTLYDGPLAYVIGMLIAQFIPAGFRLTAPVFESFRDHQVLKAEFKRDLLHGLVGKTVIHPSQIPIIHQALKVTQNDYLAAKKILTNNVPAVFQFNGAMCEPSTHQNWASQVLERAKYFGCHMSEGAVSSSLSVAL